MTSNDSWRRYLEAGAAVGQVTLDRAEEIAKGLIAPDEHERENAWQELDQLTQFGRRMGEQLADMAVAEVTRRLETLGVGSLDQFLDRVGRLVRPPVDQPSDRAESSEDPESSEPLEPPATADRADIEGLAESVTKPDENLANVENKHKGAKGSGGKKNHPVKGNDEGKKANNKGKDKASTESHPEHGQRHKKKDRKKDLKEKKKDLESPRWAPEPNRVLALSRPPDSAGTT